jgi:hypothetical protein
MAKDRPDGVPFQEQLPAVLRRDLLDRSFPSDREREGYRKEKPTVFDEDACRKILYVVMLGLPVRRACEAADVSYRSYQLWRKRWQEKDPAAAKLDWFFSRIKQARAAGMVTALETIRKGGHNWQAQAWIYERCYPEIGVVKSPGMVHGSKEMERSLAADKPLEEMTDDELNAYREQVAGVNVNAKPKGAHAYDRRDGK